ncbi:unnamed protein product, partial [Prorocentrum cordatum]
MSLSSCTITGPNDEAGGPVAAGGIARWVLGNNGPAAWPAGTTLRLVGGPVVLCPVVEVPPVPAGQTCDVELEVVAPDELRGERRADIQLPAASPATVPAHRAIATFCVSTV